MYDRVRSNSSKRFDKIDRFFSLNFKRRDNLLSVLSFHKVYFAACHSLLNHAIVYLP